MNRLLRLLQELNRLFILLGRVGTRIAGFMLNILPALVYRLILREIVWKWWLGYGERPFRVLAIVALFLVVTWLLYWRFGSFVLESPLG